ncbi:MAG TPA: DUF2628 domain-containing protein [Pseudolabrys sp.]|jgi:hypothetical protein|nr:DUF2628 domain-containing protein [Pseudolabrys sp.]
MPTYTIHSPPPRAGETHSDPERFVFVRDGFHFWAFVLAPLWLLFRRLWLALVIYLIVTGVIGTCLYELGAAWLTKTLVSLVIDLLIGFEAATIRRWTLERRGWRALGFVVAEDEEVAEQRFYDAWSKQAVETPPPAAPPPHYATPVRRGPPSPGDVIGLFPEPGATP